MTTNMVITVPSSLFEYHTLLQHFFQGMIRKLDANSHKHTPTTDQISEIIDKLIDEVVEFEEQLQLNKFDSNSLVELMDTANFAFLAYVVLRNEGVKHDQRELQDNNPNG